ncbi:MAG: TAXI family TRAP transporter solute-binding subunit [Alphaproteobacteria bacterium]
MYGKLFSIVGAAALVMGATAASANDVKLPSRMTWTAYDTTASGYAMAIAMGNMMRQHYGTELRVIPGRNDVSRMLPLVQGQADICACGIASYYGQEATFIFNKSDWGPIRIRGLFNNIGANGNVAVVAKNAGIREWKDLKGKRVAWVRGAPALNIITEGTVRFAGLTMDDVKTVEFAGWGASVDGVINDQADLAVVSTASTHVQRLAASPRGAFWPLYPHDDAEAWERMLEVIPYQGKRMISVGIALEENPTGKVPWEGTGFPYPHVVSLDTLADDTAYGVTKAAMTHWDDYKDSPASEGWKIENQEMVYIMPYHPGAVRYWQEAGVWTAEAQANQEQLLKRQDLLVQAWTEFMAGKPSQDGFEEAWLAVRAERLEAAGMPVPFREHR